MRKLQAGPLLSIDTSDRELGVDISLDGSSLSRRVIDHPRIHASLLVPTILDLLQLSDLTVTDIACVAVAKGPGSYTGLRIGVSSAKGLAYALAVPLIGISTMHAMAAAQATRATATGLITCLSSRKGEVYVQVWDMSGVAHPLSEVASVTLTEAIPFLLQSGRRDFTVAGSGGAELLAAVAPAEKISVSMSAPDGPAPAVEGVALLAAERFARADFDDVATFEPYYLKDFVAKAGASPFTAAHNR